jgi:hypothetical protein
MIASYICVYICTGYKRFKDKALDFISHIIPTSQPSPYSRYSI